MTAIRVEVTIDGQPVAHPCHAAVEPSGVRDMLVALLLAYADNVEAGIVDLPRDPSVLDGIDLVTRDLNEALNRLGPPPAKDRP